MDRNQYIDVCKNAASGKEAFVRNSSSGMEGVVECCTHEHLLVKSGEGKEYCWDYHKCEESEHS